MNHKVRPIRIYTLIFFIVSTAAIIMRTLALFLHLEPNGIYFGQKALINSSYALIFAGCIFYLTYAIVHNKELKFRATFASPMTFVPVAVVAMALLFFSAHTAITLGNSGLNAIIALRIKDFSYFILLLLGIFAIISVFYFLLNALIEHRASTARAASGILAVIFFALLSAYFHFDRALPKNAQNKILIQLAFLFISLYLLYEVRISLGRESWNLYIAFGLIAATLGTFSSIPNLIFTLVRTEAALTTTFVIEMLCALVSLFIIARLLLTTTLEEDNKCESIEYIKSYHAQRSSYVEQKAELERLAYLEVYNRFSENDEMNEEPNEAELFPPIDYTDDATDDGEGGVITPTDYADSEADDGEGAVTTPIDTETYDNTDATPIDITGGINDGASDIEPEAADTVEDTEAYGTNNAPQSTEDDGGKESTKNE